MATTSPWFFSKAEAAELLGCSIRNIEKLTQESKLVSEKGRIDVRSVCGLLRQRKENKEEVSPKEELLKVQTRYRSLKADMAELEKKLKSGDALVTEHVVGEVNRALMSLRESMMDAERRLPEQCFGRDIRTMATITERELRRILQDFHRLIGNPLPGDYRAKYLIPLLNYADLANGEGI